MLIGFKNYHTRIYLADMNSQKEKHGAKSTTSTTDIAWTK